MEKVEVILKSGPIFERIEAVRNELLQTIERTEHLTNQLWSLAHELNGVRLVTALPLEINDADNTYN